MISSNAVRPMEKMNNPKPDKKRRWALRRHAIFSAFVLVIIAAAIVRSSIATSLDSFTFDEAYHIGAGVAYVRTGDFRMNPEQPPLTKLWTGAYVSMLGYNLSPFRTFSDKDDERTFVEKDAYENNDPFVLQTRARTAMFALNGLLLLAFTLPVRRIFGDVFAVAALLFLAIDPTVAAHMPVVMTDLPVALSSGTAILLAAHAFRTWRIVDLILLSIGVGVALSAKHSGIITLFAVGLIGVTMAVVSQKGVSASVRAKRVGLTATAVLGGIIVLWAFYGFHFRETPGSTDETFNRPLAEKISDIKSPVYRGILNTTLSVYMFPRSYIWGLADTVRAGLEGRAIQVRAFGQDYYSKGPIYLFPGLLTVKLPIGLLLLSLTGIVLLVGRRMPREFAMPILVLTVFSAIFMFFLMRGSSYAGIRHALPIFPLMAVLGAAAMWWAVRSRNYLAYGGVALLVGVACVSALPQLRPWEYFNELAGGSANGYKYFNDEGVDLSQRIGEAARFYHAELEPVGEVPFLAYFSNEADIKARGMDYVGHDHERDDPKFEAEKITGTFMIGANELGEGTWWDVGRPFRSFSPTKRLGNLFIFQGTFDRPTAILARSIFYRAVYGKIYVNEPDIAAGIEGIERSLALDDSCFFVSLELGNQYLKIGDRQKAIAAYKRSLARAPQTDSIYDLLGQQVGRVENEPMEQITPLRNPGLE